MILQQYNQILFNVHHYEGIAVIVDKTTAVTIGNRKYVIAGTPLKGDLEDRSQAFTVVSGGGGGNGGNNDNGGGGKTYAPSTEAVGILLHHVDVTDGNASGTLIAHGFVNLDRIYPDTLKLITDDVKKSLKGAVWFLKDK